MQHTVTWVSGPEIEYGEVKFDYRSVCDQAQVEHGEVFVGGLATHLLELPVFLGGN